MSTPHEAHFSLLIDIETIEVSTTELTESMQPILRSDGLNATFKIKVLGPSFRQIFALHKTLAIPADILLTYERLLSEHYQTKHPGRKLTWLWYCSKNELHTNYLDKKYILITNSWQMVVLLQYNNNDTMSLEGLQVATGITKTHLEWVLTSLVRANILISREQGRYDLNKSKSGPVCFGASGYS